MTHTYAIAEVSQSTYDEIRAILLPDGHHHIHRGEDGEVLDMHGIGLRAMKVVDDNKYLDEFLKRCCDR